MTILQLIVYLTLLILTNIMESFQIVSIKDDKVTINLQSIARISKSNINKFVPICIIGPTLSGKSSIINLIANRKKLFATTNTTSSCTKGIWGSFQQIVVKEDNKIPIFVFDVQGFDSVDSQIEKQVIIMCLAYLLSNIFIMNSFGALDKNILSRFRSITQNCQSKTNKKVLFLQRDFHLELKNYIGQEIQANQYLKGCINQIGKPYQQCIKSLFCQMSMFLMTNFQQQEKFNKQVQKLRQNLYQLSSPDMFIDKQQLCLKLQGISQLLSQKPMTCSFKMLQKSIEKIEKQSNQIYLNKYKQSLKKQISKLQFPISQQLLKREIQKHQENYLSKNLQNFHHSVKKSISQISNKQLNNAVQKNKVQIIKAINNNLQKFVFHRNFKEQYRQYVSNLESLYYNSSKQLLLDCSNKFLLDFCQKYINKANTERTLIQSQIKTQIQLKEHTLKEKQQMIMQLQRTNSAISFDCQKLNKQLSQLKKKLQSELQQKQQYKSAVTQLKGKFNQNRQDSDQKLKKFEQLLSSQLFHNKITTGKSIFQQIVSQKDTIIEKQRVDMLARIDQFNAQKVKFNKLFLENDEVQCENYKKILIQKEKLTYENKELKYQVKDLTSQLNQGKSVLSQKISELKSLLSQREYEFQKKMQENISNFTQFKDCLEEACLNKDNIIRMQTKKIDQLQINVSVLKNQIEAKDNLISQQQHKLFKYDLELQQKKMEYQRQKKLLTSKIQHLQTQLEKLKNELFEEKSKFQTILSQLRGQNSSIQTIHKQQRKKLLQNMENKLQEAIQVHLSGKKSKQSFSVSKNKTSQKKLQRPKLQILTGNKLNLY